MAKYLVTGAPGWLGTELVERLLKDNHTVRCLIHPSMKDSNSLKSWQSNSKFELSLGDLRNISDVDKAVHECERVFHAAAAQHPKHVSEIYQVNTEGTVTLAQASSRAGVKKFIFVSSSTVHGSNFTNQPLDETKLSESPLTHYGRSKLQAEQKLKQIASNTGLPIVTVRPGVFYGHRPSPNLKQLMNLILNKKLVPYFGSSGCLRSYVDIERVVEALLFVAEKAPNGEAYLVGDENPLSTLGLYQTIAGELGSKVRGLRLPILTSRMAEQTSLFVGKTANIHLKVPNALGEFGRTHYFSSNKIKSLGFSLSRESTTGIKEMAKSFLTHQ